MNGEVKCATFAVVSLMLIKNSNQNKKNENDNPNPAICYDGLYYLRSM